MTSLPVHFTFGSASSAAGEAIASCMLLNLIKIPGEAINASFQRPPAVVSEQAPSLIENRYDDRNDFEDCDGDRTPIEWDGLVEQFNWDDLEPESTSISPLATPKVAHKQLSTSPADRPPTLPSMSALDERTRLLQLNGPSSVPSRAHVPNFGAIPNASAGAHFGTTPNGPVVRRPRFMPSNSTKSIKILREGKSTFGQTVRI